MVSSTYGDDFHVHGGTGGGTRRDTLSAMTPEIENLVNEMLAKGHVYIKAIQARDAALVVTFQTHSKEDIEKWQLTHDSAQRAHKEYDDAIYRLHAARDKR
jgi:hypothetical protein